MQRRAGGAGGSSAAAKPKRSFVASETAAYKYTNHKSKRDKRPSLSAVAMRVAIGIFGLGLGSGEEQRSTEDAMRSHIAFAHGTGATAPVPPAA